MAIGRQESSSSSSRDLSIIMPITEHWGKVGVGMGFSKFGDKLN